MTGTCRYITLFCFFFPIEARVYEIYLEATFHIQKIFAYHVFIVLQTWVLVCYFDRHFSSIWREQLGHGESTECPSTAFYPLCRSKAAVDVE